MDSKSLMKSLISWIQARSLTHEVSSSLTSHYGFPNFWATEQRLQEEREDAAHLPGAVCGDKWDAA